MIPRLTEYFVNYGIPITLELFETHFDGFENSELTPGKRKLKMWPEEVACCLRMTNHWRQVYGMYGKREVTPDFNPPDLDLHPGWVAIDLAEARGRILPKKKKKEKGAVEEPRVNQPWSIFAIPTYNMGEYETIHTHTYPCHVLLLGLFFPRAPSSYPSHSRAEPKFEPLPGYEALGPIAPARNTIKDPVVGTELVKAELMRLYGTHPAPDTNTAAAFKAEGTKADVYDEIQVWFKPYEEPPPADEGEFPIEPVRIPWFETMVVPNQYVSLFRNGGMPNAAKH